ncbi:hypothetical protein M0R45_018936 [Rubus argutus]|uniref:Tyrosinase copper-binding domain-containing protein n=1 Tax=Rubus argutus TaxID=59490 RepID=A0AAW1X415_RUBAR
MGAFYSAGRDPLFYAHHSNVDRMWSIYKSRESKCVTRWTSRNSGYKYQDVEIPWLTSKPTARKSKNKRKAAVSSADLTSKFPATLKDTISVEVPRPSAAKRTAAEKATEEEVLVISGIEFAGSETLKFDVYLNDDADTVSGKDKAEFAGEFCARPITIGGFKIELITTT